MIPTRPCCTHKLDNFSLRGVDLLSGHKVMPCVRLSESYAPTTAAWRQRKQQNLSMARCCSCPESPLHPTRCPSGRAKTGKGWVCEWVGGWGADTKRTSRMSPLGFYFGALGALSGLEDRPPGGVCHSRDTYHGVADRRATVPSGKVSRPVNPPTW